MGSKQPEASLVTSIIPTRIDKCWSYADNNVQGVTVKACAINFANPATGIEARAVIKSRFDDGSTSIFDGMKVKECNPIKDNKCTMNFGGNFFKECDPKHDKSCTVDLGKMLFSGTAKVRAERRH